MVILRIYLTQSEEESCAENVTQQEIKVLHGLRVRINLFLGGSKLLTAREYKMSHFARCREKTRSRRVL